MIHYKDMDSAAITRTISNPRATYRAVAHAVRELDFSRSLNIAESWLEFGNVAQAQLWGRLILTYVNRYGVEEHRARAEALAAL